MKILKYKVILLTAIILLSANLLGCTSSASTEQIINTTEKIGYDILVPSYTELYGYKFKVPSYTEKEKLEAADIIKNNQEIIASYIWDYDLPLEEKNDKELLEAYYVYKQEEAYKLYNTIKDFKINELNKSMWGLYYDDENKILYEIGRQGIEATKQCEFFYISISMVNILEDDYWNKASEGRNPGDIIYMYSIPFIMLAPDAIIYTWDEESLEFSYNTNVELYDSCLNDGDECIISKEEMIKYGYKMYEK